MANTRLKYIDISKGIAILALLLSHSTPGEEVSTFIFGFHMPIFFIIGGILLSHKEQKSAITVFHIGYLLKHRCSNLLVPYLFFCTLLTLFYGSMSYISGNGFSIADNLWKTFTFQGIDSLWFIPFYFFAEILCHIILIPKRNTIALICMLLLGSICMAKPFESAPIFVNYLAKIIVCAAFFISGYFIAKFNVIRKIGTIMSILILIIGSAITMWSGFSAIGSMQFPHGALYLISALLMSTGLMVLIQQMADNKCTKMLCIFGRYSIVVLCTNNLVIEICRLIDYKLTGSFLLHHGLIGSLCFTTILTIIEYYIIRLAQGRMGIIFGKR